MPAVNTWCCNQNGFQQNSMHSTNYRVHRQQTTYKCFIWWQKLTTICLFLMQWNIAD